MHLVPTRRKVTTIILLLLITGMMLSITIISHAQNGEEDPSIIAELLKRFLGKEVNTVTFNKLIEEIYYKKAEKSVNKRNNISLVNSLLKISIPIIPHPDLGKHISQRRPSLLESSDIVTIIQRIYAISEKIDNRVLKNRLNEVLLLIRSYITTGSPENLKKAASILQEAYIIAKEKPYSRQIIDLLNAIYGNEVPMYEGLGKAGYQKKPYHEAYDVSKAAKIQDLLDKYCPSLSKKVIKWIAEIKNGKIDVLNIISRELYCEKKEGTTIIKALILSALTVNTSLEKALKLMQAYGISLTKRDLSILNSLGLVLPLNMFLRQLLMKYLLSVHSMWNYSRAQLNWLETSIDSNLSLPKLYEKTYNIMKKGVLELKGNTTSMLIEMYKNSRRTPNNEGINNIATLVLLSPLIVLLAATMILHSSLPITKVLKVSSITLLPKPLTNKRNHKEKYHIPLYYNGLRGRIIHLYWLATSMLNEVVSRADSETHREYLRKIEKTLKMQVGIAYRKLTILYERARFSRKYITHNDVSKAERLVRIIHDILNHREKGGSIDGA